MNKRIKFIKGTFRTLFASTFIIALLFAMSCDNSSDEPEPETLAGTYVFNKAVLQTSLSLDLGLGFPIPIAAGRDITNELEGALLEAAPCTDPKNGAVDLRDTKVLYFTCINESGITPTQAGVWSENSDLTELNLNLASPPLPDVIQLSLKNLVVTGDIISGSITSFPLTPELMAGFLVG
ncbi:MAG: hypothetical protein KAK04_08685, partial [Cyclobacteriaceae bacterium]|nr:hypothetical protein [Cyclobacteriaceae bacterium]